MMLMRVNSTALGGHKFNGRATVGDYRPGQRGIILHWCPSTDFKLRHYPNFSGVDSDLVRVQVLMSKVESDWFDVYCREKGYKKSPLIARLIRKYPDREDFNPQPNLFAREE